MARQIMLGNIGVDVELKDIKNVHLSVYPPTGKVRISAPLRMSLDTIRVFAISKLDWIKQQQRKLQHQVRETPREYLDRESHYVWGRRYLLKVAYAEGAPQVELKHTRMHLRIHPGASEAQKQDAVDAWYREQIKLAIPSVVAKWEPIVGVKVNRVHVQRMKTKWGGCSPVAGSIRINAELAKKPRECLEYIIVHELVHLLEPTHNRRFAALMDQFVPKWRFYREALNQLPVRHEQWRY
jgi:predicted metal-dependent hydrolase